MTFHEGALLVGCLACGAILFVWFLWNLEG